MAGRIGSQLVRKQSIHMLGPISQSSAFLAGKDLVNYNKAILVIVCLYKILVIKDRMAIHRSSETDQ